MKKPIQCVLWNKTNITPFDLNLELKRVFIRGAHLKRELFKCRECGQLYFHEWYEHMYFKRDADMYDTFIPVETEEEIEELSKAKSSADLIRYLPQLHGSFTNSEDESLQWIFSGEEDVLQ